MTFVEFAAVMRGFAIANGAKVERDVPSDDDFYADLAAAQARGEA